MAKNSERVYYALFPHKLGCFRLAATDRGVIQVSLPSESDEKFWSWLKQQFPKAEFEMSETQTSETFQQLSEYFDGQRRTFSVALDLCGTEFQKAVWQAILRIPYGKTSSYGELAKAISRPDAARAVGAATGSNPIGIIVPCHRVVGSNGSLTGYGGGLPMKEYLLKLERGDNIFSFVSPTLRNR